MAKAEQTPKSKAANTKKEKERSKVTHESEATPGKASDIPEGLQSRSHTPCVMQFSDKPPQPHIRTTLLVLKRALEGAEKKGRRHRGRFHTIEAKESSHVRSNSIPISTMTIALKSRNLNRYCVLHKSA
jgi:hypothetical protein